MQSSPLSSSPKPTTTQHLSPERKGSEGQNHKTVFSSEFFTKNAQMNEETTTDLPGRMTADNPTEVNIRVGRPRSDDLDSSERPTITISRRKSEKEILPSEPRNKRMVRSTGDLQNNDPIVKPKMTENKTNRREKLCISQNARVELKSAMSQIKSSEEMSDLCKNEILESTPLNFSVDESKKSFSINALKTTSLLNTCPYSNSSASLDLGEAILSPRNRKGSGMRALIANYLNRGIENPKGCSEDMWRSMERIKIFGVNSDQPILNGSDLAMDEKKRHAEMGRLMGKTLNLLFQHVSHRNEELIWTEGFGATQDDAGNFGDSLAGLLEAKEREGMDKSVTMIMQRILGLFNQVLFTQPAMWTVPNNFKVYVGSDELEITEFGPTVAEKVNPLEYDRKITIILKEDGGLDYIIEQPLTFKVREDSKLLGTCRLQTTFIFDKGMKCLAQNQEVKAAKILES